MTHPILDAILKPPVWEQIDDAKVCWPYAVRQGHPEKLHTEPGWLVWWADTVMRGPDDRALQHPDEAAAIEAAEAHMREDVAKRLDLGAVERLVEAAKRYRDAINAFDGGGSFSVHAHNFTVAEGQMNAALAAFRVTP